MDETKRKELARITRIRDTICVNQKKKVHAEPIGKLMKANGAFQGFFLDKQIRPVKSCWLVCVIESQEKRQEWDRVND